MRFRVRDAAEPNVGRAWCAVLLLCGRAGGRQWTKYAGARGARERVFSGGRCRLRAVSAHSPRVLRRRGPRAAWPATEHWRHRHTDITHQKDHHHEHLSPQPASFAAVAMIALAAIAASLGLAGYGVEVTAPASEIVQLEPVDPGPPYARRPDRQLHAPHRRRHRQQQRCGPASGSAPAAPANCALSGTQRRSTPGVLWFESPHPDHPCARHPTPGLFVRRPQPRSMEKCPGPKRMPLRP